jgi:phosphonate dehydrogenase
LTTKPKVVITHRVHEPVRQLLAQHCDVAANDGVQSWSQNKLLEVSGEADALLVFMPDKIDQAFLAGCPRLRVIAAALKGYDNIDVEACTHRGIWVAIVPDLLSQATAELALALVLGLIRNVAPGDRWVRSGRFRGWSPVLYGGSLNGKTIGILGMGKVGQAFARLLAGFNVRTIYYDPVKMSPVEETFLALGRADFKQVLEQSDIVVVMVPLMPSTYHLVNGGTLSTMKKGAYLVNVGRGSVVDEGAVAKAVDQGLLAGYAADVFEMEDWSQPDHPVTVHPALLFDHERTLLTPHLGTAVDSVRMDIELAAAQSILQALRGERPAGAVNSLKSRP